MQQKCRQLWMWFPSGQSLSKAYCFVIFGIFVIYFLFVIFHFLMIFFIFEIFDIFVSNLIVVLSRRLVFLSRLVTGSYKNIISIGFGLHEIVFDQHKCFYQNKGADQDKVDVENDAIDFSTRNMLRQSFSSEEKTNKRKTNKKTN